MQDGLITRPGSTPAAAQSTSRGVAAIVEPYSSGSIYATEFRRRGWFSVAVVRDEEHTPLLVRGTLRKSDFDAVVTHRGALDKVAEHLRDLGVSALVAGCEFGVPLADQLAAELGLPGNDPASSHLRRDKAAMVQALLRAGIPAIPTLRTRELDQALAWAAALGRPCILKPVDSAGSDGVSICSTATDLEAAWRALHGRLNAMGELNTDLVVQELVTGMQYVVNTVSWRGRHAVTDIWADHRVRADDHILYDYLDLLSPDEDRGLYQQLRDYTCAVLTALGVEHGPAHSELMLTAAGPVLIETGARPEGCLVPYAMEQASGTHHVRAAVDAVIAPEAALERTPSVHRHAHQVMLRAPYDAVIDPAGWRTLLSLPGVAGTLGHVHAGSRVTRTTDLLTSPDTIYLVGSRTEISSSRHAIRALESHSRLGWPLLYRRAA